MFTHVFCIVVIRKLPILSGGVVGWSSMWYEILYSLQIPTVKIGRAQQVKLVELAETNTNPYLNSCRVIFPFSKLMIEMRNILLFKFKSKSYSISHRTSPPQTFHYVSITYTFLCFIFISIIFTWSVYFHIPLKSIYSSLKLSFQDEHISFLNTESFFFVVVFVVGFPSLIYINRILCLEWLFQLSLSLADSTPLYHTSNHIYILCDLLRESVIFHLVSFLFLAFFLSVWLFVSHYASQYHFIVEWFSFNKPHSFYRVQAL